MLPPMSSFTFTSVADVWPVGTSVSVYRRGTSVPLGTSGSALFTEAVAADGSLTFSGLTDDTAYVATDGVRSRQFWSAPVSAHIVTDVASLAGTGVEWLVDSSGSLVSIYINGVEQ